MDHCTHAEGLNHATTTTASDVTRDSEPSCLESEAGECHRVSRINSRGSSFLPRVCSDSGDVVFCTSILPYLLENRISIERESPRNTGLHNTATRVSSFLPSPLRMYRTPITSSLTPPSLP
ncbi:hypothetical protein E2C01_083308 [Portunus trituberculatus]|uniref:Uncharacterized protein n=1 Tax=Portunus trituberculatus TaxID=210409 RepID=A0A5B7J355_PORTR|nr:hypothetical protein [Portunus trituberculatus]